MQGKLDAESSSHTPKFLTNCILRSGILLVARRLVHWLAMTTVLAAWV
jgi:hypothetical protein